jgi:hypothetical protein
MKRYWRSALFCISVSLGATLAPAANACRIGHTELLFPSIPSEVYDANFVAKAAIVGEAQSGGGAFGQVSFTVIESPTHKLLEGLVVTGEFEVDSCGPLVSPNQSGFLIGKIGAADRANAPKARLFKLYSALGGIITDDGLMPLVME